MGGCLQKCCLSETGTICCNLISVLGIIYFVCFITYQGVHLGHVRPTVRLLRVPYSQQVRNPAWRYRICTRTLFPNPDLLDILHLDPLQAVHNEQAEKARRIIETQEVHWTVQQAALGLLGTRQTAQPQHRKSHDEGRMIQLYLSTFCYLIRDNILSVIHCFIQFITRYYYLASA